MRLTRSLAAAAVAVLLLGPPGAEPALAVDEPEVLLLRARGLAAEQRCEEALPLLERAQAAAPADAAVAGLRGQCLIALQRWPEAVTALEEAQRLDPSLPDIDLHLGIARFHQGDLAGSAGALEEARARGESGPELDLYEGLLALQRADDREAATRLERARRSDPLAVEPIASYYAGLAWQREAEEAKARDALERVKRESPGTPWAAAAGRALESATATRGVVDRRDVQGVPQAERPLGTFAGETANLRRWASLSIGSEYDDNVVLKGNGVELPSNISGSGDWRMLWTAEVGAELFRDRNWSAGLIAATYGTAQIDISEFNTQYPTITGWLDRRIDEATTARLQYDFGYAWVDADPFLVQHTFTPALFHEWGKPGVTRAFVQFDWNNFLSSSDDIFSSQTGLGPGQPCTAPPIGIGSCGPAGLNEENAVNRDGFGTIAGLDHTYPLTEKIALRAGYRYLRYSSRGREYSYQGHQGRVGARALLPEDVILDVQTSYSYVPYRNSTVFPNPDNVPNNGTQYFLSNRSRRDKIVQVDVILERPITEWLIASGRYTFVGNDSNADVYDFNRNIFGMYLTVQWGR